VTSHIPAALWSSLVLRRPAVPKFPRSLRIHGPHNLPCRKGSLLDPETPAVLRLPQVLCSTAFAALPPCPVPASLAGHCPRAPGRWLPRPGPAPWHSASRPRHAAGARTAAPGPGPGPRWPLAPAWPSRGAGLAIGRHRGCPGAGAAWWPLPPPPAALRGLRGR
jgi:hypothetical protein